MTNLATKLTATIATGAVLLSAVAPAFADTSVTLTGNGETSNNSVSVTSNNNNTVVQSNNAIVSNNVSNTSSTGGNSSNGGTGGNVTIHTGDAGAVTNIANNLNQNAAEVSNCACDNGVQSITVSGNGEASNNSVSSTNSNDTQLFQNNEAAVNNTVDNQLKTGENSADSNTGGVNGGGNVTITTGSAGATTYVTTNANSNTALVGAGVGAGSNGGTSLTERGNGELSNNSIALNNTQTATVTQDNRAYVENSVDNQLKTGENHADGNTGVGDTTISTGHAASLTDLTTNVNLNAASIGCDCLSVEGLVAKIAGEGESSNSSIALNTENTVDLFQGGGEGAGNDAYVSNDVNNHGKTGLNSANSNTGSALSDPSTITTGGSYATSNVTTNGNENLFSTNGVPQLTVGFDWNSLWTSVFGL